jgi:MFS family permease
MGPVLIVTTATQALTTLAALALAAVAPKAAGELGVSPALIGYQVGVVYFGAMLAALVGGQVVRRFGATRTSQLALWMVAVGCALGALGTLASLAVGALIMGLGYGMTNPAASQLLSRAPTTGNMNLIFSIKQCGVPIGGVLAGILVPPLTVAFSWQTALVFCAVLLVVWGVALGLRRSAWDTDRQPGAPVFASPFASIALIWGNPTLRWLALASLIYSGVQLCLTGFLVTYLVTEVGLSLVLAGSLLAITHGFGAVGRLAWGWLADRLRSGSLALVINGGVSVAGALAVASIASGWPVWLMGAATALFGFCAMGWNGVFMAVIARQSPQNIGMATGGSLSITYAGIVVGPAAFAALHDRGSSYGTGFAFLALVTLVGIACVLWARRESFFLSRSAN